MGRPEVIVRMEAAQAAVDRFNAKPFKFGHADCIQLGAFVVKRMGYPNPLKGTRPYAGEIGALRAFREAAKRLGVESGGIAELLDAMTLERIEVASALPGDLLGFPADEGGPWGIALGVHVGNGRALAFTPEGIGSVGEATAANIAWRVEPCQ